MESIISYFFGKDFGNRWVTKVCQTSNIKEDEGRITEKIFKKAPPLEQN